jgi:GxxExxY protein
MAMHPLYEKASSITKEVIGAAIEVHRIMGPGLLESVYQWCLRIELELRGFSVRTQATVVISYRGFTRIEELRCDMIVDDCLLVEIKAVETVHPIHKAQVLSYLKLLDYPIGLLINFNVPLLSEGVSRLMLRGADRVEE